ncbi:MAG TPA: Gfo/Idh/MocA family oxidoreductase [Gemmatimonadaceae bacterium]|nr:Gfo/Idh/MocA family oxidoreductase [Gemmatimonadaceae bacterium]
MSKQIRFGLVGCGTIAKRHAALLSSGGVPGASLAAVCDTVSEKRDAFATQFGAAAFASPTEMVASNQVDAVAILTPSGLHAANVVELARYGLPIVVEKPMALTLDDADRMIEACDRYGARLFVIKQNRFNRPVTAARAALEAGRFGRLVLGTVRVRWCRPQAYYDAAAWRGTWAHDGGVLANQASHHIDLLEWMMGDVDSVTAMSTHALAKIEAEDTAVAILKFRNGALGVIEATTATRPKDLEGGLSILGERGSVEVGGFAANELKTWNFAESVPEDAKVFADFGRNPDHASGYAHAAYYQHVVACINDGRQQLVDGLEGRRSLELIVAIYESIEAGKEIELRLNPKRCRLGRG